MAQKLDRPHIDTMFSVSQSLPRRRRSLRLLLNRPGVFLALAMVLAAILTAWAMVAWLA
jgi:hypothetical protein